MIYHGTYNREIIVVHPEDNENNYQLVEMGKEADQSVFSVEMWDGDEGWSWEFILGNNSDYERVKYCIFEAIFEADTMKELAGMLDDIFNDGFSDILLHDMDCEECGNKDTCEEYLSHMN